MKNFKPYLKEIISVCFIFILAFSLIKSPQSISKSILVGINYCVNILIPSLFPFMFLSRFASTPGLLDHIKKPLGYITKLVFYLPGSAAVPIILSLVGGYPVGASAAATLISEKEINEEQLSRLMCFAVNAGPAFIINVVACSLLKNPFLGYLILSVQILISVTFGIILGIIARIKHTPFYEKNSIQIKKTNFSESLINSTYQTAQSIIMMCGLILLFTSFTSVLKYLKVFDFITDICNYTSLKSENLIAFVLSILEVTGACSYATRHFASVPFISFIISYGGICTHFQIASILKDFKINYTQFQFFRILNALFSFMVTHLVLNFFELPTPVFISTVESCHASSSGAFPGSIALILLCLCFTMNIKKTGI